jgi:hypothetical protein
MNFTKLKTIGGWLLVGGASLNLVVRTYSVLWPTLLYDNRPVHIITSFVFGNWLAKLIWPVNSYGYRDEFRPLDLIWAPWAAVIIIFLLWTGVRVLQNRNHQRFLFISIIGIWLVVGFIFEKFTSGFLYLYSDLSWKITGSLADLAIVAIVSGIGLLILDHHIKMRTTHMNDYILRDRQADLIQNSATVENFKTLSGIGKFVEVIGWLAFAVGIVGVLSCLAKIDESWAQFMILIWGGILLAGVLIVAQGQVIRCFVSIERNTQRTSSALAQLAKNLYQSTSATGKSE